MSTSTRLYRSLSTLPFSAEELKPFLVRAKATTVQSSPPASGFNGRQGSRPMSLTRDNWLVIVTTQTRLAAVFVFAFITFRTNAPPPPFFGHTRRARQLPLP